MKSGKLLLGVLAGFAAGAALGILFAPEKGSTIRKKITGKGEDINDALKDKFDELVDSIAKRYEHIENETDELVIEGKKKIAAVKKGVPPATS